MADDLTTGVEEQGADSLAAPAPPLAPTIARNQIAAGQVNHGDSRDWAENMVSGVQAALAGFGAAGRVNPGSGALAGVGAAARQALERRDQLARERVAQGQRQQSLNMEQQRVGLEERRLSDAEKQTQVENARQQSQDIRAQAEHDMRMRQFTDEHNLHNFQLMQDEISFRENQLDREETLKGLGAQPMKIAGAETPAFDDLGQLEDFAVKNGLAQQAHVSGYRERPIFGADGKYHIYQVPDTTPEWHTIKGPDNKPMRIFGDPTAVLNLEEKVSTIRYQQAHAALDWAEGQAKLRDLKDQDTAKQARAALDKVGGDYDKLTPGQKLALRPEVEKQAQTLGQMQTGAQKELERDPDWDGTTEGAKYEQLRKKYHLDSIDEQLGDSLDALRHLGYGHTPPGGGGGGKGLSAEQFQGALGQMQKLPRDQAEQAIRTSTMLSDDEKKRMLAALGPAPPPDTRNLTQKVTDAVVQKLTGHPGPTGGAQ